MDNVPHILSLTQQFCEKFQKIIDEGNYAEEFILLFSYLKFVVAFRQFHGINMSDENELSTCKIDLVKEFSYLVKNHSP